MKIEEITTWAKEFLLEAGTHAPTLFVETDAPQMIISELSNLPATPKERLSYFSALGRRLASEHPGAQAREATYIALSWGYKLLPGQPAPKYPPWQDPNRRELMSILHVTLSANLTTRLDGQLVEIIRDNEGKVRDLFQLDSSVGSALRVLLILFMLGFQYPEMPEHELRQIMHETLHPQ